MSAVAPVNPKQFLQDLTGKSVWDRLKWGLEYRSFLVLTDANMNLQVDWIVLTQQDERTRDTV